MTLLDLYKLPDLDKRAVSGTVSVYIYPASGQRAVQLVQSVSKARWTLTVGHTKTNPRLLICLFICFVIKQPIRPRGPILVVN